MKTYLHYFIAVFLSGLLLFQSVNAQLKNSPLKKIYATGGVGIANRSGNVKTFSVEAAILKNILITVSKLSIKGSPNELPEDYLPAYSNSGWGSENYYYGPADVTMDAYTISGGKIFSLSKRFWFSSQLGISYIRADKQEFTKQTPTPVFWYTTSNYSYTMHKRNLIGGQLKLDLNWAITKFAGIGFEVFSAFNSQQPHKGCNVKLLVGILR